MKMKMEKNRDYRQFIDFEVRALDNEDSNKTEMWVEGYATKFNEPTILYSYDGIDYKEQVDDRAFNEADLSDVIFNYNHSGKVLARTRNNTLFLSIDDKGLYMKARVDGTEEGRKIYEEIKGGYIDKMSYSYSVEEDAYDRGNHIRTIRKVKKLYDVSAVDIPAYDGTSIYARSCKHYNLEEKNKRKRLILLSQI